MEIEKVKAHTECFESDLAEAQEQARIYESGASVPVELIQRFNIIKELWELGERATLRKYLSQVIDHIDLRTDGQQLVGTVYLRNLPELRAVQ